VKTPASFNELRRRVFSPLLARFDVLDRRLDDVESRLDRLARRVDDIEALIQATDGRVSTMSDRTLGLTESEARTARRVEEIERLLGLPGDR